MNTKQMINEPSNSTFYRLNTKIQKNMLKVYSTALVVSFIFIITSKVI